jgi:hypothetical protein
LKSYYLLILLIGLLTSSCSTSIKTNVYKHRPGISYSGQTPVFTLTDDLPENAKIIGELKFLGNLDNNCTTGRLIEDISARAKEKGANAIKITHYIPNNDLCPDVNAYLVYLDNIDDYQDKSYHIINHPTKALVHFYRRSVADMYTQFS